MKKSTKRGFTLVELLVVMALIAVLAVLILGAIQLARNTATETVHRSNAKVVQAALESQFAKYKEYCSTAADGSVPTGELQCGTGANGLTTDSTNAYDKYSLTSVAAALTPAAGLSNGASVASSTTVPVAKCGTGATDIDQGGGRVTNLTPTGYAIIPVTYNCQGYTSINDVIQTGLTTALTTLPTF